MFFSGFVAKCSDKWRISVSLSTFNSSAYSTITKEMVLLSKEGKKEEKNDFPHWNSQHGKQLDPIRWADLRVRRTAANGLFRSLCFWWTVKNDLQLGIQVRGRAVTSYIHSSTYQIHKKCKYIRKCIYGKWRIIHLYAVFKKYYFCIKKKNKNLCTVEKYQMNQMLWLYSLFWWDCMFPLWTSINSDQYIWKTSHARAFAHTHVRLYSCYSTCGCYLFLSVGHCLMFE